MTREIRAKIINVLKHTISCCLVLSFFKIFCYCHLKSKHTRAHLCMCRKDVAVSSPAGFFNALLLCFVLFLCTWVSSTYSCRGFCLWQLLTFTHSFLQPEGPPQPYRCTPLPSPWAVSKCVTHTPHHLNRASEFPSTQRHLSHGVFSGKRKPSRTTALKIARAQPFHSCF